MSTNKIPSHSALRLLELVKASLWQTEPDSGLFTGHSVDWNEIGRLAMLQTVGPLAMTGASVLPHHLQPPKDWRHQAYRIIELNRRTHQIEDSCVAEVFSILEEEGLNPVLLKGQAYARYYPDPTLRQCGDIDIYVGPESYRQAYEVSLRNGWTSDEKFFPDAKHYGCNFKGVRIELHRQANVSDDQWDRNNIISGDAPMDINRQEIRTPSPLFDTVFVFRHLFNHFLQGGIGLRHLCDWVMILHRHSGHINIDELRHCLQRVRLLKPWRLFTAIAVDYLGLPPEECPFYSTESLNKARMILSFIFQEGNFGRGIQPKTERPKGYFSGKAYSFHNYSLRIFQKLPVYPSMILRLYLAHVWRGFSHVVHEQFSKSK